MSEDHWNQSNLASEAGVNIRTVDGTVYMDDDLAAVGQALLMTISSNSGHAFLKNWQPADCPSEIVCDLLNALDEAKAKNAVLVTALTPFAAFHSFRVPDEMTITSGSPMARRQLTMGDCRKAVEAVCKGADA